MGIAAPVAEAGSEAGGTGRCVVLVTPDGERTMSTYLGAAVTLKPSDLDGAIPDSFDMLFVEGYLWDAPQGAAVIETPPRRPVPRRACRAHARRMPNASSATRG